MYLTLADLKTRLKITGNDQDALLEIFLDDSRAVLTSKGLDYEKKQRTKIVQRCKLYETIYFDCPEVESIDLINTLPYVGIKGIDYVVLPPYDAVVKLVRGPDRNYYRYNRYHEYATITYTAGYATAPRDLVRLQFLLCQSYYLDDQLNSSTVTSVKLGPREIKYADPSDRLTGIKAGIDSLIRKKQMHYV